MRGYAAAQRTAPQASGVLRTSMPAMRTRTCHVRGPEQQRPVQRQRLVVVHSHHHGQHAHLPEGQGPHAMYNLWTQQPSIGAEHGEGFVHFRPSGVQRVDVESLNDSLRTHGALRLRHAQHPHEAYGGVFNFDGVVGDLAAVKAEAWQLLATKQGHRLPAQLLRHPELNNMPPQVAIVRLLRWASNPKEASQLAMEHAALAADVLACQHSAQPGVREWLDVLGRFNVPCALVTCLDRSTVQAALARMTLHDHFSSMVTAEDEADSISQRLLIASMKLGRAPNSCVYYDNTPAGVTAAHNCTMKAVAVQGDYPAYQLKAADLTCSSLAELTVYNLRRLFANSGSEFMDLQKQTSRQSQGGGGSGEGRGSRSNRRVTLGCAPNGDQ